MYFCEAFNKKYLSESEVQLKMAEVEVKLA
jgi:hypothetical protein